MRCKQASKAGVLGLTQAGAAKLVFHGIRVNAVSPTITATVCCCAALTTRRVVCGF